ncbi:hypothetical protein ABET51_06685 [Metabacillus fastidiosus]|uniref:hypothetical protein n=1 Tax=Metabacillus fastidiosus TaxID=1458 RepID=UPI003D29A24C
MSNYKIIYEMINGERYEYEQEIKEMGSYNVSMTQDRWKWRQHDNEFVNMSNVLKVIVEEIK